MTVYLENTIVSTKKLLDLISEFGKIPGYKIHMRKLMAFLFNNNKVSERETRKKIPLTIAIIKIKYLRRNLTKEVKDMYLENYRTHKKKN